MEALLKALRRGRGTGLLSVVLLGTVCGGIFFGGVRPAAKKGRELIELRGRLRAECWEFRSEIDQLEREREALETDWYYNERLRRLAYPESAATWVR